MPLRLYSTLRINCAEVDGADFGAKSPRCGPWERICSKDPGGRASRYGALDGDALAPGLPDGAMDGT